jgi:multidrug efflux pump subunit AcrB
MSKLYLLSTLIACGMVFILMLLSDGHISETWAVGLALTLSLAAAPITYKFTRELKT